MRSNKSGEGAVHNILCILHILRTVVCCVQLSAIIPIVSNLVQAAVVVAQVSACFFFCTVYSSAASESSCARFALGGAEVDMCVRPALAEHRLAVAACCGAPHSLSFRRRGAAKNF